MKIKNNAVKLLKEIYGKEVYIREPLKNHTSFKIGGEANVLVYPKTLEEIVKTMLLINKYNFKYYILGNGTNVLCPDEFYNGIVLCMNKFTGIDVYDNKLEVWAGTPLNFVVTNANLLGLKGMEQAMGIPGTVGGAVIMNASAYDYETSNVVSGVLALVDGKIKYFSKEELNFNYRNSVFSNLNNFLIIRVDFELTPNASIKELQEISMQIMEKRKTNQPLEYPSAGSVFKRIDGVIVSKLIDEAGLKGYSVGDAQVSKKHAGFIINLGKATNKDVKSVIKHIKNVIKSKYNLTLIEEIKYLK